MAIKHEWSLYCPGQQCEATRFVGTEDDARAEAAKGCVVCHHGLHRVVAKSRSGIIATAIDQTTERNVIAVIKGATIIVEEG